MFSDIVLEIVLIDRTLYHAHVINIYGRNFYPDVLIYFLSCVDTMAYMKAVYVAVDEAAALEALRIFSQYWDKNYPLG